MINEQPEALRLADLLQGDAMLSQTGMDHAAEELRRLHALNEQMLEALRELLTDMVIAQANMRSAARRDDSWEGCSEAIQPRVDAARAAIAAATGRKP